MSLFSKKAPSGDAPRRRQATGSGETRREVAAERQQGASYTFRRNRTLTGSASPHVSTVNEPNADLQSPRTQVHQLAHQRRKLGTLFMTVVLVAGVIAALLYEFTAQPVIRSSDAALSLEADRYSKVIDEYLGRRPVERLRFALDDTRLTEYVHRELPEVESVTMGSFVAFGQSSFTVTVRQPIAGWLIGDRQYYVDATGVPFQKNYFPSPTVNVVDDSGIQQTAGTAIASSRFLNFVGRTVSAAAEKGFVVEQAIIPTGTTRQLELKIKDMQTTVKLSLDRSIGEQVEDMERALAWFEERNQTPEYIDVRVSGRAFYR